MPLFTQEQFKLENPTKLFLLTFLRNQYYYKIIINQQIQQQTFQPQLAEWPHHLCMRNEVEFGVWC